MSNKRMVKDRFRTFDGLARHAQKLEWRNKTLLTRQQEDESLIAELFHRLELLDDGSPEVAEALSKARKQGYGERDE